MQGLERRALPYPPLLQPVIFGGEKGAQTVPKGAGPGLPVDAAKKLEKSGVKSPEIFQQTGWYRGPDGEWKWTLSDKGASLKADAFKTYYSGDPSSVRDVKSLPSAVMLKREGPEGTRKLTDILDHPTLFETYPQFKNTIVKTLPPINPLTGFKDVGSFDAANNVLYIRDDRSGKDVLSTILHELQHGVQSAEGFGKGGSWTEFYPADVYAGRRPPTQEEVDSARQNYFRLAGETEARQVQKQFETQNWSQRPTQMEGFPTPEKQWVRQGNATTLPAGKSYQLVPVDHNPFLVPVDYDPFSAKPVDHDPYVSPTNVYEHALQQYPILRDQGVVGVQGYGPMLESWPANEPGAPGRPRPAGIPLDTFGVEYRDSDRPIDILGDVVSHHMIEKDPVVKKYYENFTASLNEEQRQRLQEQYQHAQQNEGETRPYEQWEEKSGMPAYFRGYPFQQWPDEFNQRAYTPEQRDHLDRMMDYLRPPASPTPY